MFNDVSMAKYIQGWGLESQEHNMFLPMRLVLPEL